MNKYVSLIRFGGGGGFSSSLGGGGISSGGGYSSGGYYGGYYGSGSTNTHVSILSAVIFVIVVIVIIIVMIILNKKYPRSSQGIQNGFQTLANESEMGMGMGAPFFQEADITQITSIDPNFSKQRFLDHVQSLFAKFQQAWSASDITTIQAYLTESMYTRLQTQISELIAKNEQDVLENIAIGGLKIVKCSIDNNFEYLSVQIDASMKDYDVNKDTGKVVSGNKFVNGRFTEYWEFIRSKSVQSDYSKGFVAQTCPNCGAPIDINEFGECKYCKAKIISGNFDWVLDNIYQQGEFQA